MTPHMQHLYNKRLVSLLGKRLRWAIGERRRKAAKQESRMRKRYNSLWTQAIAKGDDVAMLELAGYTVGQLKLHIERQFKRGMNWENRGGWPVKDAARRWHIDHIVPKSLYRSTEMMAAYALSNLRPLWGSDNFKKSARRVYLL